jgi:excisionase family DNA binding protein
MEPVLLRVQEAAALLKVSKWTVYRWIEEGRLRATKIGRGSLRVFRESLVGLVRMHQAGVAGQSASSGQPFMKNDKFRRGSVNAASGNRNVKPRNKSARASPRG